MSEKNFAVDDARLKRVHARIKGWSGVGNGDVRDVCLAFAEDLAENPIVPTDKQVEEMKIKLVPVHPHWANIVAEWQRRMFLAPERPPISTWTEHLSGYTFTQEEADAIKDYVQTAVHPQSAKEPEVPKTDFEEMWNACTVEINRLGGVVKSTEILREHAQSTEPKVDPRTLIHRLFHKLWTASVHQEGYEKEDWNKMDGLLNQVLYQNTENKA
jgi:hypothetical protein